MVQRQAFEPSEDNFLAHRSAFEFLFPGMETYNPEETYNLKDLNDWGFEGVSLAVLGHPVRHSISPAMHNAAIKELAQSDARFSNWRYFRFEVKPEDLIQALPLFNKKGFFGLNLTVPHKEIALNSLKKVDPAALEIGAVNTLRRLDEGYEGFNTDGFGLSEGIRRDLQTNLENKDVVILGAGGAGRAAAVEVLNSQSRSLKIVNRNPDRLEKLLQSLDPIARRFSIPLTGSSPSNSELSLPDGTIIINATSLGLNSDDPLPLPKERVPQSSTLFDMIYNPQTTQLMECVASRGGRATNGLSMLVHQGARSLEIWTDASVNAETMSQAANEALLSRT